MVATFQCIFCQCCLRLIGVVTSIVSLSPIPTAVLARTYNNMKRKTGVSLEKCCEDSRNISARNVARCCVKFILCRPFTDWLKVNDMDNLL